MRTIRHTLLIGAGPRRLPRVERGFVRMVIATEKDGAEVIVLEREWAASIKRQDVAEMEHFLADDYFLAIGVQGEKLQIVPRDTWLETLKVYETESFDIEDMHVHVYGDVAIVLMQATQKATVRGQDRSGNFVLTDVWRRQNASWRVVERHSSRPEPATLTRPQ